MRRGMNPMMKSDRGVVMILVLTSVLTISLLAGAFAHLGVYEHRYAVRNQEATQAFYLSESAVDQALRWLRAQPGPPTSTQFPLGATGQDLFDLQGNRIGSYGVSVVPDAGNPVNFLDRFRIEGWGVSGSVASPTAQRQTVLTVQTESFARYAYFTDNERSPSGATVWFITGDRIEGPTHTNGRFSMYGNPVFDGPVSSVATSINYFNPPPAGGNNPVFNAGLQLGVQPKPFPSTFPSALVNAASSGGMALSGNTTVSLDCSGTMRVTNAAAGYNNTALPLPGNGVLYVGGGNVNLSGCVNGQLTIGTDRTVNVTNSIVYSDDPAVNPASDDLLGIVAGDNILVTSSAPYDVQIDAVMMALNTSFMVQNYWIGPPKGTLGVLGGLIQERRGPVGTFNAQSGTKKSGYTKDYHYDQRLLNLTPPFFPTTGDYVTLVWQGED